MKAVVAAFNQEKALALVGAFAVITNLRVDLRLSYQAVVEYHLGVKAGTRGGWAQFCSWMSSTASFRSRPQPGDTPTRRPALDRQHTDSYPLELETKLAEDYAKCFTIKEKASTRTFS